MKTSPEVTDLPSHEWRWSQAEREVDNADQGSPPSSDPALRVARQFLRMWRSARDVRHRERLAAKMPAMAAAHQLRFDPNQAALRHAVETRVLAGESVEVVAWFSGITPRVVALYEALFFDVRGRLHARDFIARTVIGVGKTASSDTVATRRTEKLLSFCLGPYVADELLAPVSSFAREHSQEHVDEVLTDAARTHRRRNLAFAMCKMSLSDGPASRDLIRSFATAEAKSTPTTADDVSQEYEKNIKVFLDQIEPSVGRRSIPEENRKYYTGHVEPRADEWLAITGGGDVSGFDEKIEMSRKAREERAKNDDPATAQTAAAAEQSTEEE